MSEPVKKAPAEMNARWNKAFRNPESNKDSSFFRTDDRPIVIQPTKDGRFDVLRQDARYEEGGSRIKTVETRGDAEFEKERWDYLTPRTDRTKRSRTTATFYGFNVPDGGFK